MSLLHVHGDDAQGLLDHGAAAATHGDHGPDPGGKGAHPCGRSATASTALVSALDRLDPRSRVLAAVMVAVTVAVLPPALTALTAALAVAVLFAGLARLRLRPTLERLAAIEGFVLMTVILLPFTQTGPEVASLAGFALSAPGLVQAAAILLKAATVALVLLALVGTLDSVVFAAALARLGAPERLVQLYLFTIRYMDVLHREYRRLRLAMRARGFAMRARWHCWTTLGQLFGMLLVRSVERSERILAAMRCRGFDGQLHRLVPEGRFGPADGGFALAVGLALSFVIALAVIAPGRFP